MNTKDVILELRTKKGLSQDELAEKIFVTRQAVSRWENGETVPNVDTLKPLAALVLDKHCDLGIATDGIDRSQTTVTVPNLISTEWSNAQVQLNIKGLKHQLMESASDQTAALVTCQYPHAGAKVPYGTTVYLYTDTYDGSLTEVPDVSGKSADFARQMLSAAGLNCVVEGDANGVVQSQSSEVGASVQRGTIVTITCG